MDQHGRQQEAGDGAQGEGGFEVPRDIGGGSAGVGCPRALGYFLTEHARTQSAQSKLWELENHVQHEHSPALCMESRARCRT